MVANFKNDIKTKKANSEERGSRRCVLKGVVISGGAIIGMNSLPSKWVAPVIDAVILPVHAQTSDCTTSCLVAATYCEGSGRSSITVVVSEDGSVEVSHQNGTELTTVDACNGGSYSVTVTSSGLNVITLSGTIPCGAVESITILEENGMGSNSIPLFQNLCPV